MFSLPEKVSSLNSSLYVDCLVQGKLNLPSVTEGRTRTLKQTSFFMSGMVTGRCKQHNFLLLMGGQNNARY
jgi:hypothetical protein